MKLVRIVPMVILAAFLVVLGSARGSAHDGEGILTVESSLPTAAGRDYVVRLTWADDGHAAVDATVTATAIAAGGTPGTPVSLAPMDQDGRYGGEVALPASGTWTVRITAVTPASVVEVQEQVAPSATTTTATPASASTSTVVDAPSTTVGATPSDGGKDEGGGSGAAIAVVVLVAIVIGGLIGLTRSRGSGKRT